MISALTPALVELAPAVTPRTHRELQVFFGVSDLNPDGWQEYLPLNVAMLARVEDRYAALVARFGAANVRIVTVEG